MRLRDPRPWGALFLLVLAVGGYLLDRRAPDWIRADPLAHPFGRVEPDVAASAAPEESAERQQPRPVHLATATAEDLDLLPGIGPKTAARILALRDSLGTIGRPEELLAVRGIGTKRLEQLKPWLLWSEPTDTTASGGS